MLDFQQATGGVSRILEGTCHDRKESKNNEKREKMTAGGQIQPATACKWPTARGRLELPTGIAEWNSLTGSGRAWPLTERPFNVAFGVLM